MREQQPAPVVDVVLIVVVTVILHVHVMLRNPAAVSIIGAVGLVRQMKAVSVLVVKPVVVQSTLAFIRGG